MPLLKLKNNEKIHVFEPEEKNRKEEKIRVN